MPSLTLTVEEQTYFDSLQARQYWPESVPRQPCYPHGEIALSDYVRAWAQTRGAQDALIFYGTRISFAELDAQSERCAALLHQSGVRAGDRVAVILGNCPQFFYAFFGILKLGAIHVPVNPLFKEAELVHELGDAGARVAIALDSYAPLLLKVRERVGVTTIFTTALGELLPANPEIALPPGLDSTYQAAPSTTAFLPALAACPAQAPAHTSDLDAPAALNYTGGTTGLPKGCIHTQRDMLYTAATSATVAGVVSTAAPAAAADDISLGFLPMFWIAGENAALLHTAFTGGTLVLLARWDPLAAMQAIARYRIRRCALLVDNALEILEHPHLAQYDLHSIEVTRVISFVRKITPDFRRRWQQVTGSIAAEAAWGMTETHTQDTFTTGMQAGDRDLQGRPGFVGLPVPGTYIKICDFDSGALMEHGQEGEIVVHTPSLFKGYWQKPEASAEVLRGDWFHTGDIGMYDEHGCLHYLGRRKEMLKVRGMSVFPAEVEILLGQHPQILSAAVVGRNDADKGQVPVAFVQLRAGAQCSAEALQAWCREQMAGYKVPEIRLTTEWPMTTTGKIRKHELQEWANAA